jgi:hypothetical protein
MMLELWFRAHVDVASSLGTAERPAFSAGQRAASA